MEETNKRGFTIKREIDFGDLLTPFSIMVAILTVWLTWNSDRDARIKQYADGIRGSASTVTAKLERWSTLADRYFDDIQPTLIATSKETASKRHDYKPARTILFLGLIEAESTASQRIVDEQLEIAYLDLYGYVPSLRPPFDQIREDISAAEQLSHKCLKKALQDKLNDQKLLNSSDSADMGNALRDVAREERKQLKHDIRKTTDPLVGKILKLINLQDKDLADPNKRAAQIAIFSSQGNSTAGSRYLHHPVDDLNDAELDQACSLRDKN
jgi:hypothetical protein